MKPYKIYKGITKTGKVPSAPKGYLFTGFITRGGLAVYKKRGGK